MLNIDGSALIRELTIDDLKNATGGDITFPACLHKIKKTGSFSFVTVRTGRYLIQTVHYPDICAVPLTGLHEGAYAELCGTVKEESRAMHGFEVVLKSIKLLSSPAAEYPLRVFDKALGCTLEAELDHRSAALRHPRERAIFKAAAGITAAFRDFMLENSFTEIHTPKLRAASDAYRNRFRLKYFGTNAELADSPQLYMQTAAAVFDRVFEIAPAYRADKHNSARHLSEYTRFDFEMSFIRDITDVMQMTTALLKAAVSRLNTGYQYELKLLEAELPAICRIPAVTFYEALDILGKPRGRSDLDPTDEAKLSEYAKREHNSEFIFVTKLPGAKLPFYIMDSADVGGLTESFVLLYGGLEAASGGQHIHDYSEQIKKLKRLGINPETHERSLSSLKYGMPPHGGLGIGLERLVMKLLGLENIREASMFPRDMHRIEP